MALQKKRVEQGEMFSIAPQRYIFAGPSGSGKTNALVHAIMAWFPRYYKIIVFSKSIYGDDANLFAHVFDNYEEELKQDPDMIEIHTKLSEQILNEILEKQEQRILKYVAKKQSSNINILLIFDDMMGEENFRNSTNKHPIEKIAFYGRHLGISAVFLVQGLTGISPTARKQSGLVAFPTNNASEREAIYDMAGLLTKKEFNIILDETFSKPYRPFIFQQYPKARYYMGYDVEMLPVYSGKASSEGIFTRGEGEAGSARDDTP